MITNLKLQRNSRYNKYQRGLASVMYKYFDKESADTTTKFVAKGVAHTTTLK